MAERVGKAKQTAANDQLLKKTHAPCTIVWENLIRLDSGLLNAFTGAC